MIDPYELYNRFASKVNTYQGGFFRIQTDFERAANDINMELWKEYTAVAEKTQEITDYLAPFTRTKNIIVKKYNSSYGFAEYPSELKEIYARFSNATIRVKKNKKIEETVPCESVDGGRCIGQEDEIEQQRKTDEYYDSLIERPVELIDNSRWAACLEHETKHPTLNDPKMRQADKGFWVAPRQISVITLTYYVEPQYVKINYTLAPGNVQTGDGDQIIYQPSKDNQFQWSPTLINKFLDRLKDKFAEFTRDQVLAQI